MRKLTKSNNRVISGVCGGIGEYFNIDPTIVRVAWALFAFAGGSGVVLYIVCAILMPSWYNQVDGVHPHGFHQGFPNQGHHQGHQPSQDFQHHDFSQDDANSNGPRP